MNKYLLESLENGSHGIIPTEDLNYFVGNKRITVYKDGKKIIDKEVQIDDDGNICKYNIICDDDKEPELVPATDVEEYNVANMLPQVYPEGSVLRKEEEEDYEEIIINDNVTEAAAEVAAIVGGTVVLTGILAVIAEHEITKRKAIDWYADQYEVSPKFSELKKKNYKVKYNSNARDVTPTDKEKLINFDKNNVAEIYYYNDKRAFGVIYGCNVENFIWMPGYTSTTYRINVRIVVYNPEFKKHIEYYAAKSMIKHQYTMRSIDDWIRGIMSDYRKFKKDEKKADKAQKKIKKDPNIVPDSVKESELDFSSDLDTVLETCDSILTKIESYKTINESEDISDEEVITESADLDVEESVKDKVKEVTDLTKSELEKIKKLASEKIDITKALKKEVNSLKKSDLKRKLIKNQKDIRKLVKGYKPDTRKKVTKAFGSINPSTIHDMNLQLFMDQVRRDDETAMRAHQTAMDMHNQAVMQNQHMVNQQMMMNSMKWA